MIFHRFSQINKKEKDKTFVAKNFILKHIILYVQCVDLLLWSLTKLNFSFYDFSMIYNDFSKIQLKIFFKKKDKTTVIVANLGYCSATAYKTTQGR